MTHLQAPVQFRSAPSAQYEVGFLFNHEASHQVAHSAPIAEQLALTDTAAAVTILATSERLLHHARACIGDAASRKIKFELLLTPAWQAQVAGVVDAVLPFSRITNLVRHKKRLAQFDVLVVPERTSLMLKSLLGNAAPLLIHTKHGSGDRAQGYSPNVGKFDLVLLSGAKLRDRLLDAKCIALNQCAIVGYPKFDMVNAAQPAKLFNNTKPTVIYNPHPQPGLSSWFDMGLQILEYFADQQDFNLIFAPHVMLFRRKLHISLESGLMRVRRDIPRRFFNCANILIDTDSSKLMDMTYTRASDIYLGDVSSQIYEFLLQPRPMVFLNPRQKKWQGDPNYQNWTFGPVVSDTHGLDAALRDAVLRPERYRLAQERGFRYTFDLNERPSSLRAANAISQFAAQKLFSGQRHSIDAHGGRVHAV